MDTSRGRQVNLPSLEALRGILATFVVCHHARLLLWTGYQSWSSTDHPGWANALAYLASVFRYGHEAVTCFFVLSGFFIHFRWANHPGTEFDIGQYVRRRAHRLIPPYAIALVATVVLDTTGHYLFPALYESRTGDAFLDASFARTGYTTESVVSALLLLPSSTGQVFGTNGPLWSLAYEFIYYALYIAWIPLRMRIGAWAYAVAIAGTVIVSQLIPNAFVSSVLAMYPLWLLGAGLAELMLMKRVFLNVALLASMALAGFAAHHFVSGVALVCAYAFLGVGVVGFAACMPAGITRYRLHGFLEALGERSYTIYIVHFPFLALLGAATFALAGTLPVTGWLGIACAVAAVAFASILWSVGERRFLHPRLVVT